MSSSVLVKRGRYEVPTSQTKYHTGDKIIEDKRQLNIFPDLRIEKYCSSIHKIKIIKGKMVQDGRLLNHIRADEGYHQFKEFINDCSLLISHDNVDFRTIRRWMARKQFSTEVFDNKTILDSQSFYKQVMKKFGFGDKCGMESIVANLASDTLRAFYQSGRHEAIVDAETLCRLSTSKKLAVRFFDWMLFEKVFDITEPAEMQSDRRSKSVNSTLRVKPNYRPG